MNGLRTIFSNHALLWRRRKIAMLGIIHANKQLSLLLPFLSHNGSAAVNGSVAGKLVLSPVAEFCNHSVA